VIADLNQIADLKLSIWRRLIQIAERSVYSHDGRARPTHKGYSHDGRIKAILMTTNSSYVVSLFTPPKPHVSTRSR